MTCVVACKEENLTRPSVWWDKILEIENPSLDHITYLWHACMHCDNPPCVGACPEKAISKRQDGIVLIDQKVCKGSGQCIKACPYGVITMNPTQDYFQGEKMPYEKAADAYRIQIPKKASKCTLCVHRIDQGKEPICVSGCPSKAKTFGDLDDPASPIRKKLIQSVQLLPSKGAYPKVSYIVPKNILKQAEKRVIENPNMAK
jgi:molybdopterin-containing oxidoreductase family iron-sulfur binding subunit